MDPRRGDKTFPVIGDPPFRAEGRDQALAELKAAGFTDAITVKEETREEMVQGTPAQHLASRGVYIPALVNATPKEIVTRYHVVAKGWGWTFHRAWYYWCAEADDGRAIPEKQAQDLNAAWSNEIRVRGYAGGTNVDRPIDSYHVDTPAGLKTLVELLKELA